MRGLRNSEFVVSLALLATLVGHIAIQRQFEHRTRLLLQIARAERDASSSSLDSPFFGVANEHADIDELPTSIGRSSNPTVIPAVEVQREDFHRAADPPTAVPPPADAEPATGGSDENTENTPHHSGTSAVRSVIEHELADSTREEREIWFEELKSVPPEVVRDLLKVRKQLHALPQLLGGIPEKLASADPSVPSREIPAEPASQKIRFNLPDQHSATAAIESAVLQLRHNLMNASTPGFKRLRVMLVDTYGPHSHETTAAEMTSEPSATSRIRGEGCRMAPVVLDLTAGSLKKTSRAFDLAIDGDGFFVVRQGEKEYLTRCGAFALDRDRQLALIVTNQISVLQPPIKIPDDATEVQISAQGAVTMVKAGHESLTSIGQLQLGRVASPARLTPAGNTLFLADDASGAIALGSPMAEGFGTIQQGCLEQSNVNFDRELEEIDELLMILKALPPHAPYSATARSLPSGPQR